MARLRANYVFGTTNAALTTTGTTLSSPSLARLPVVASPDYAAVILADPTGGTYEVVYVTAHAAGATTATIRRAADFSTAAAWPSGTAWSHGLTAADLLTNPADDRPATPSAYDDEFDGTSSVTWTATPTAAAANEITSRFSHLHLKASGTGSSYVGSYQAIPAAFPFTITAKCTGTSGRANYHRCGGLLFVQAGTVSTTSRVIYFGDAYNNTMSGHQVQRIAATNFSTFEAQGTAVPFGFGPWYLRAVFTSATAVSLYCSTDGWSWALVEAYTVPFSVGYVGLACSEENALGGVDTYFDFFRVT